MDHKESSFKLGRRPRGLAQQASSHVDYSTIP